MNFKICFEYPWLLLLLIPAALCTFIPYFRIKKRYRRTRNRIISIVLHSIVMVLSITVLSGFYVRYYVPNEENEIILLVDVSDTEKISEKQRDQFVENVIEECAFENISVGVVTFGFDQRYAVPLTRDYENVFSDYLAADLPDTTATNLVGALEYAASLFKHPKTGKIVVVTDGKETDGQALAGVSSIVAQGITVDLAYVPSNYEETDAQVLHINMPEQYVGLGEKCEIGVVVRCDESVENATIKLYDNEVVNETEGVKKQSLTMGEQVVFFKHTFEETGLHEIKIELELNGDGRATNNAYCSYYNMQVFNKILIIESQIGTSDNLVTLLNENKDYEMTVVEIGSDEMPTTVDGLRAYDQVIMNNVSNMDLPVGFDVTLKKYVEEHGGGLFTTGGKDSNGKPHAYNKQDMYGSVYQSLLPVQADVYTPPIGVMFILDQSGSMAYKNDEGGTFFDSAKQGIAACLSVLYDRDYVGIMTLDTYQSVILEMTPRTQEHKITEALSTLTRPTGNTVFTNAIETAGHALRSLKNVSKRHVVIVSDGEASDASASYMRLVDEFYQTDGITFSVVGVHMSVSSRQNMKKLCETGHGRLYEARNTKDFEDAFEEDLLVPTVKDVNDTPFNPIAYNVNSPLLNGVARGEGVDRNRLTVTLNGFHGGKIKDGADLILIGEYSVPIYAQWKYGAGTVGSFMSDLQASSWSTSFMADASGKKFIRNVVNNLMPTQDIRPNDITVSLREDNYTNTLNVFPKLKEGETVKGELVQITTDGEKSVSLNEKPTSLDGATFYTKQALGSANKYTRCEFIVKESGVYAIRLTKYDEDGNKVGNTFTTYKTFSYSEEYDETMLLAEEERKALMASITEKGKGTLIEDMEDMDSVLKGFQTKLEKTFDPRFSFMIAAIVLFVLDIAVCKFKFKWIHEIIRDRKRKNDL